MQQLIQQPLRDITEEEGEEEEEKEGDEISSADWEHVSSLGDVDERVSEDIIASNSARQRLQEGASNFLQTVNVQPSQHPIVDQTRIRQIDNFNALTLNQWKNFNNNTHFSQEAQR